MKRVVLLRSTPVQPDPPVEKMANTLLAEGYHVTIVAWDRNSNEECICSQMKFSNGTAEIVRFGIPAQFGGGLKKTLKPLICFQWKLFSWLMHNRNKYDIIHAFDFDTGYIACKVAKLCNKKTVYHILDYYIASHGLTGSRLGAVIEKREIKVINSVDATVICTEKRREQIAKACPRQLYVIHNTPDGNMVSSEIDIDIQGDKDKAKIVYVGIFGRKRFLQETFEVVRGRDDIEFHIGGFGDIENEVVREANTNSNVFYYGRLPYAKTLALEKHCDIMFAMYDPVIPNHQYSAPNKFYEALMLGKPIIMAKNTGFDDVICKEEVGVTAEYSADGLMKAVSELIMQRPKWKEISKNARALYEREYSWDLMHQRIREMYSNL